MRRSSVLTAALFMLIAGTVLTQSRTDSERDSTRVPPWLFPSATLENSSLRIWNEDTLLTDLKVLSVFANGEEYIISRNDLQHYSVEKTYTSTSGGMMTVERSLKSVFDLPFSEFYLEKDRAEQKPLSVFARPDSLYMVGERKNGDWYFRRMYLGERDAYEPGPWYYEKRTGGVWCDPPDHAPPWKFFQKKSADL